MRICGIVACDTKYGIGKNNQIPWENAEDLKWFKQYTTSGEKCAVLMGRKTFQSIGQPLPNRLNVVISSHIYDDVDSFNDIGKAINYVIKNKITHLYVIGGSQIYKWFADHLYYDEFCITRIDGDYSCDTFIDCKKIKDYLECVRYAANPDRVLYTTEKSNTESNFKNLIINILDEPCYELNRTQFKTKSIMNQQLKYSLRGNVLPATTLRRQWLKGIFVELMWFIKGRTDLEFLHKHNVHIWDANYINSHVKLPHNDIGATYGAQWRNFNKSGFDQLKYIIDELKNNSHSRRIMLSSWCPPMIFEEACLPPCHISYTFNVKVVNGEKRLYCQTLQRSSDVALALAWNVISGSFFTHLLAAETGCVAEELAITICNAHIYENHEVGAQTMLVREPKKYPRIKILNVKPITEYEWSDIQIIGYDPHPSIDIGEMAV